MAGNPENFRVVRPDGGGRRGGGLIGRLLTLLVLAATAYGFVWWFVDRVEVGANQLLVILNKTGGELPPEYADQVVLYPELVAELAKQTGRTEDQVRADFKGIRYDVMKEGRYFFSPVFHQRLVVPATLIPEDKFGVLVRKYGRLLEPGKTVASEPDERGPVAGTLPPGRHDINPFAYDVQTFDKIIVPEGHVGVQTLLAGPTPASPNEYVVQAGERGVQPDTLGPGTYFDKNPFVVRVDLVDVRSQKYDMLNEDAIEFPSNDGFTIHMEATVEWSVYPDRGPWVTVEVGDLDDVVTKVIRPYTMSLARIQGSKRTARDFIGARETFQRQIFDDLRSRCREQGVLVKAVNVRDLKPPERVRAIIRAREMADQTITKFESEITEAMARADLVQQEELATQQSELGDANKEVVSLVMKAEQGMAVAVTEANRDLDVAKLDLEASRKQAEAILSRGQADAKVVLFGYQAQAEPLAAAVRAFGDGDTYARNQYLQKVAPAIRTILTNTEGPFAEIFRSFGLVGADRRAEAAPGARSGPALSQSGDAPRDRGP